jgi:hypothetical protein
MPRRRIVLFPLALFCAAAFARTTAHPLAAASATATTAQRSEHILFDVDWMDGGVTEAEVIALLPPGGGFREEPSDTAQQTRFIGRWLRPGHAYTVLAAGRPAGSIVVRPAHVGGCNATGVQVTSRVSAVPASRSALATDAAVPAGPPLRRPATVAERRELTALLRAAIVRREGARGWRADAKVDAWEVVLRGGAVAVAGSAVVKLDPDDVAAPVNAAFLIAERSGGALRPVMTWSQSAHDPKTDWPRTRALLDAADLDGDGMPEIVTRTDLSEEWQYTIYRRTPRGWAEAYNSYGGGC